MSLVFGSREVAVGPTVGYKAGDSSPPAYVGGHGQKGEKEVVASGVSCISALLKRGGDGVVETGGFCLDCKESGPLASSESSSIGAGEDSSGSVEEKEEGEDEVQSKFNGGLGSMGSLEESLPIKRGLSNFFSGKSKSFASLSDVSSVKDLLKAENPLNKRRRILLACKTQQSKRAFCSPLNISMPNIALEEETDEEEGEEERKVSSVAPPPIQGRKFKCFKSPSDNQCPNGKIGPASRSKVQFRPLQYGESVANQDGTSECEMGREGRANIPFGVVRAGIEIAIEATVDAGLEEVVVEGKKEDNWPALEVSVKSAGAMRASHVIADVTMTTCSGMLGVFAEAVKAIECESDGGNPRPKEPRPAEIHPEEGL